MTGKVEFCLESLDANRTRIHLNFRATAPLPPGARQLAELLLGRLHVDDLEQLKAHVGKSPLS